MSTTLRRYWLKTLRTAGVKHFRAKSGLGVSFICHMGDFASEVAFIDPRHSMPELRVMAEWCRQVDRPVIFDVGANNGFIATQLAQLLEKQPPIIYAFEPIASTYAQMRFSVEALGLMNSVVPICCAVSDKSGVVTLAFNPRESLFAQVRGDTSNPRAGTEKATAAAITIDQVVAATGLKPDLLKVDVEGFEPRVFGGAEQLLQGEDRPAICFEWNPTTMTEVGNSGARIQAILHDYQFYYISDFEGGRRPLGEKISELSDLETVCNVFAIPKKEELLARWRQLRDSNA